MSLADLPVWAALPVAAAAGLVSFASPCVLPLLPGYAAWLAGDLSVAAPAADDAAVQRTRLRSQAQPLVRSLAFVAGFAVPFTVLGAGAAAASEVLVERRSLLELVAGIVVALLGLSMLADRTLVPARLTAFPAGAAHAHSRRRGMVQPAIVGAASALAWTPCIGPVLAAILVIAGAGGDPVRGAALLLAWSLGLGVPFVVGALAIGWSAGLSRRLRLHARAIRRGSGLVLLLTGAAIATGLFGAVAGELARLAPGWLA